MQELGDEERSPSLNNDLGHAAETELKHSTPSPTKFSLSPSKSYKVQQTSMFEICIFS